jgi:uncharacterized membrane protein YoaK (UPF0700 family)
MTSVPPAFPAQRTDADAPSYRLVALLAFVAGYVDVFGFVALFGLFTAHVTANFVLIGANVIGQGQGSLAKLTALPAFIAGVALTKIVVLIHARRATRSERTIYVIEALCLAGLMVVGVVASPLPGAQAGSTILCGVLGALAMGIQSAHGKLALEGHAPTTMMTQNLTQAVIDAIEAGWAQSPAQRRASRSRLLDSILPVCGFAVGALVGAISWAHAAFWALLFPVALLSILAMRAGTGPCAVGE